MVGGGEAADLAPYWSRRLGLGVMEESEAAGLCAAGTGAEGDDRSRRRRGAGAGAGRGPGSNEEEGGGLAARTWGQPVHVPEREGPVLTPE